MDYSAQVVTSPDRALYSREQRMHVLFLWNNSQQENYPHPNITFLASSLADCSGFLVVFFFFFAWISLLCFSVSFSVYTFPDE